MVANMESTFSLPHSAFIGVVFSLTLFLFYCSSLLRTRNKKESIRKRVPVPEARGAWPLIGHLHLLGGSVAPHVMLGNMSDEYGPIFSIKMGVHRAVIVNSWEVAKQCLTVNDRVFASRPKCITSEVMGYNHAMFGHVRRVCNVWPRSLLPLLASHAQDRNY